MHLPVACPHCAHANAFTDLVVLDRGPGDGFDGDSAHRGPGPLGGGGGGGSRSGFPAHVTVVCKCGHTEHAPAKGCGRVGNVSTKAV